MVLRRVIEEYNAGSDFCPACGRGRRFLLQVRALQLSLGPVQWQFLRRYRRTCTHCGYQESLTEPPQELPLELGEAEGPPSPQGGEAGAPPAHDPRGELYGALAQRMDFVLSPLGARARQEYLEGATAGVGGLLLEHARREASALVRQAAHLPDHERTDFQALEKTLEEALFAAAWEGYLAYAVLMRLRGVAVRRRLARSQEEFVRQVAPRAYRRAERGRAGAQPELVAWFSARSLHVGGRLREMGQPVSPRLRPEVERAARGAMYLGYAVAVEEGRW